MPFWVMPVFVGSGVLVGHHMSRALMAAAIAIPAAEIALIIFFIASDQASARSATSSIVITQ